MSNSSFKLYEKILSMVDCTPLSELLSLSLRLSHKIRNKDMEKWIQLELNGYFNTNPSLTEDVVVPEYRTIVIQHFDKFGEAFIIRNPNLLFVNETRLRNGVSELERLSKLEENVYVQDPYLIQLLHNNCDFEASNYGFNPFQTLGILTSIRTKLIDWLHEIEPQIDNDTTDNSQLKSDGTELNNVDKFFNKLKNHRWMATIIIICIAIISIAAFTDSISKLYNSGINIYNNIFGKDTANANLYLHIKISNTLEDKISIFPFVTYYLTEDQITSITQYQPGRLEIESNSAIDTNGVFIIPAKQTIRFFAKIPDYLINSELFERGAGNMHIKLDVIDSKGIYLESIPFNKGAIMRYFMQFKIINK